MGKYIIALFITLVAILMCCYLITKIGKWRSLIVDGIFTTGRIDEVTLKKSNASHWFILKVSYSVDGKTYTIGSTLVRSNSYKVGQEIRVKYLKRFPSFSTVAESNNYLKKPDELLLLIAFLGFIYVFLMIRVLIDSSTLVRQVTDLLITTGLYLCAIANYFNERSLKNYKSTCKGVVSFSETRKDVNVIVAEYTVNSDLYFTREFKKSIKSESDIYQLGDEIEVKYSQTKPYRSIISDDVRSYDNSKKIAILATIMAVLSAAIVCLH